MQITAFLTTLYHLVTITCQQWLLMGAEQVTHSSQCIVSELRGSPMKQRVYDLLLCSLS